MAPHSRCRLRLHHLLVLLDRKGLPVHRDLLDRLVCEVRQGYAANQVLRAPQDRKGRKDHRGSLGPTVHRDLKGRKVHRGFPDQRRCYCRQAVMRSPL